MHMIHTYYYIIKNCLKKLKRLRTIGQHDPKCISHRFHDHECVSLDFALPNSTLQSFLINSRKLTLL